MELVRREIHFSGRVQGVGFRYTTQRLAAQHSVTGYVRNEADGRVRLVVEGPSTEVAGFVRAVQTQMEGNIQSVQTLDGEFQNEFNRFEIRH